MPEIRWEGAPYTAFSQARVCDIDGARLYVRRSTSGKKGFTGYINGKWIGSWKDIGTACQKVEETWKERSRET